MQDIKRLLRQGIDKRHSECNPNNRTIEEICSTLWDNKWVLHLSALLSWKLNRKLLYSECKFGGDLRIYLR